MCSFFFIIPRCVLSLTVDATTEKVAKTKTALEGIYERMNGCIPLRDIK